MLNESSKGHALRSAQLLALDARPASPQAERMLDALVALAERHESRAGRGNRRGAGSTAKLRLALAALVGGLLLNASEGEPRAWCFALTRASAFSGQPIGHCQFTTARLAMVAAKLVEEVAGHTEFHAAGIKRWATRFRLTAKALKLAERHGLTLRNFGRHWRRSTADLAPPAPVILKALSGRVGPRKLAGEELPLPRSRRTGALAAEVDEFRAFVRQHEIGGCDPVVLRRQFTETLDYDGRWYALGSNSYQSLPEQRRLRLTIDGEPVAELDLHAAGLSVVHGLLRLPLPKGDLCARVRGLPREVVKRWIVAAIGKGAMLTSWPAAVREGLLAAGISHNDFPARDVGAAVASRYPFLRSLAAELGCVHNPRLTGLRAQNVEANAITAAMFALKRRGVLALPMHDALIVPDSTAAVAKRALRDAFKTQAGIAPTIGISRA